MKNKSKKNKVPTYLAHARRIKEWMQENQTTNTPLAKSINLEERKLGKALEIIRSKYVKPYLSLKTEEERDKFRKEKPEIDEIMQIVTEIDNNNLPIYLVNARAIRQWMQEKQTTKPPSKIAKDLEEKRLGTALATIRQHFIKPYLAIQTEDEREKYRKKHPEIDEIMRIVKEIDEKNISLYLVNARLIKQWMQENNRVKPPSKKASNTEEKKLGQALWSIRLQFIKPYFELQTEAEKIAYIEEHPELDEVMQIVSDIDLNSGRKGKTQELAILIQKDLSKRKTLTEAKQLELMYEQQLKEKGIKDSSVSKREHEEQ